MPELRLREVRLPELRLPEMTREDIVRTIGDARRDLDFSALDLSRIDVPRAIATATQAAGLVRATRRPRLPFVIGGLVAIGLVGFAILRSPAVRPRVEEAGRRARQAIDERRAAMAATDEPGETLDLEGTAEPVAVPIEPDAFASGESAPEASETVPA